MHYLMHSDRIIARIDFFATEAPYRWKVGIKIHFEGISFIETEIPPLIDLIAPSGDFWQIRLDAGASCEPSIICSATVLSERKYNEGASQILTQEVIRRFDGIMTLRPEHYSPIQLDLMISKILNAGCRPVIDFPRQVNFISYGLGKDAFLEGETCRYLPLC